MRDVETLLSAGDDGLFRGVAASMGEVDTTPDEVAALFNTALGHRVLDAMMKRWVTTTIVEPGVPPEVHGIRQGQANVVFWISDMIARSQDKEV